MNNINIIVDGSSKKISKELVMGEQLNMREIGLLDGKQVTHLLPASIGNYNGSMIINYDVSVLISLNEYLKEVLTMSEVINLLDQVVNTFIEMQNLYLSRKKLILDFNYIMVNSTMKKIFFTYLPVMGFDNNNTVNNFLIELVSNIKVDDNSNLLHNFEEYLKGNEQLELIAIKKFIDRLSAEVNGNDENSVERFMENEDAEIIDIDVQPSIPNLFEADTPVIKSNTQEL